jgi:hypothetical protein
MSVGTIILIILLVALLGGNLGWYGPGYAPYRGYGWGGFGLLFIILIVLLLAGRI